VNWKLGVKLDWMHEMQNKPEQSTPQYFAELAKRYELHKQTGVMFLIFNPDENHRQKSKN
jgi:hypothetical protein